MPKPPLADRRALDIVVYTRAPIEIVTRSVVDPGPDGLSLLDRARSMAADPTVFDEQPPFFWQSTISTDKVDAYGTRMMTSSLQNYADDATAGVAVLQSHQSRELPIGLSILGTPVKKSQTNLKAVKADAYMLPMHTNGSVDTAQVITGIRSGIYRDVSIGWYGGTVNCTICKGAMFGWNATCWHWPGVLYRVSEDPDAEPEMAIGEIEDAHLAEYSIVYDGATPGAMIEKIHRMVETGRWDQAETSRVRANVRSRNRGSDLDRELEGLFQPYRLRTVAARTNDAQEVQMDEEQTTGQVDATPEGDADATETISSELEAEGAAGSPDPAAGADAVDERIVAALGLQPGSGIDAVLGAVNALRGRATDGERYHTALATECQRQGVRALGPGFNAGVMTPLFERMTCEQLEAMRDEWKRAADATFQPGRSTTEEPLPADQPKHQPVTAPAKRQLPNDAFKIR